MPLSHSCLVFCQHSVLCHFSTLFQSLTHFLHESLDSWALIKSLSYDCILVFFPTTFQHRYFINLFSSHFGRENLVGQIISFLNKSPPNPSLFTKTHCPEICLAGDLQMDVTTQQLGGTFLSMVSNTQTASWWLLTASGPVRESFHSACQGTGPAGTSGKM
uniref:Uncharacterized protein n=1 Tax=Cyanistes caeruleus TaxID=156563 RepID=A0A8C0Z9W6_CYACU